MHRSVRPWSEHPVRRYLLRHGVGLLQRHLDECAACGRRIAQLLEKKPAAGAQRITRLLLKLSSKGKIINPGLETPNRLLFTKKF